MGTQNDLYDIISTNEPKRCHPLTLIKNAECCGIIRCMFVCSILEKKNEHRTKARYLINENNYNYIINNGQLATLSINVFLICLPNCVVTCTKTDGNCFHMLNSVVCISVYFITRSSFSSSVPSVRCIFFSLILVNSLSSLTHYFRYHCIQCLTCLCHTFCNNSFLSYSVYRHYCIS